MTPPTLKVHDGGGRGYREGEDVLNELFYFMRHRIPEMHPSDPVRVCLSQLAPYLGESLGRPPVAVVEEEGL